MSALIKRIFIFNGTYLLCKMKIIQWVDVFHPRGGGLPVAVKRRMENLPEYDFEVVTNAFQNQKLVERHNDNVVIRRFLPNDIMLDEASDRYKLYAGKFEFLFFPYRITSEIIRFRRKCEYLKKADYDIFHLCSPITNYTLFTFDRNIGRACLTKLNDFSFIKRPKVLTIGFLVSQLTKSKVDIENEKKLVQTFDNIICTTEFICSIVKSYLADAKEEKNIWNIPNLVDISKFKPTSQEEKMQCKADRRYENKIIVTYVGRLDKKKGLYVLIESWKEVISRYPNAHLLLVGGGREKSYLTEYANELKISKNVEFAGETEDVYQFLKISDIFVLPTFLEGFSTSLIEAMACELPVVSTNVTGIPDIVDDAGIIVEPRDTASLSSAIDKLIGDENLRKKLGKKGRKIVEERYSDTIVAKKIKMVYESLV